MKYIRTENRILIAPGLYDGGAIVLTNNPPKYETRNVRNEWGCIDCDEIIKLADTIEELCDEFVFIGQDNVPILMESLQECLDRVEDLGLTSYKIFAAIWTGKGLIYVAKMNKKGELELL